MFRCIQRSGIPAMLIFRDSSAEPKLSKVNAVEVIYCCPALFLPRTADDSEMSMSLYYSASIAEKPMLCVRFSLLFNSI